jgi:VanZ family protein
MICAIAFVLAYRLPPFKHIAGLVLFCATVEILQLAIPGRHARISDFLVDFTAALIGVGLAELAFKLARGIAEQIDII